MSNTYRTISDGNVVVLQSLYSGAWNNKNLQTIVDVFRFEKGLIVEHWDNAAPYSLIPNPSGNTQLDGVTKIVDLDKTASNKKIAKDYINTLLVKGDYSKIDDFIKDGYDIQHSTRFSNGAADLANSIKANQGNKNGMHYSKINEHWGVRQEIPAKSQWKNDNGKF